MPTANPASSQSESHRRIHLHWLCLTLCHLCIFDDWHVHVSEERPQTSSVPNSFEHNWSVLLASTKTASSWLFLILPKVAHGSATYLTRIFCYWCSGLSNPSIARSTEIQSTQTKVCLPVYYKRVSIAISRPSFDSHHQESTRRGGHSHLEGSKLAKVSLSSVSKKKLRFQHSLIRYHTITADRQEKSQHLQSWHLWVPCGCSQGLEAWARWLLHLTLVSADRCTASPSCFDDESCHKSQGTYEIYLLLSMWNHVASLFWHTSRIQKGDLADTLTRHNDLWLTGFRLFVTCLQTVTLIFCGAMPTPVTYLQICLHCCQVASWLWEAMRSRLPSVLGHQPQSSSQHGRPKELQKNIVNWDERQING